MNWKYGYSGKQYQKLYYKRKLAYNFFSMHSLLGGWLYNYKIYELEPKICVNLHLIKLRWMYFYGGILLINLVGKGSSNTSTCNNFAKLEMSVLSPLLFLWMLTFFVLAPPLCEPTGPEFPDTFQSTTCPLSTLIIISSRWCTPQTRVLLTTETNDPRESHCSRLWKIWQQSNFFKT